MIRCLYFACVKWPWTIESREPLLVCINVISSFMRCLASLPVFPVDTWFVDPRTCKSVTERRLFSPSVLFLIPLYELSPSQACPSDTRQRVGNSRSEGEDRHGIYDSWCAFLADSRLHFERGAIRFFDGRHRTRTALYTSPGVLEFLLTPRSLQ